MDPEILEVLGDYETRNAREEAAFADMTAADFAARLDEFLLPVGPATGSLLNLLAREAGARSILEIGTSYGYSTIWLAEAARATGGRVDSLELAAHKIAHARRALERAGLSGVVDLHEANAVDWICGGGGRFDFVLLDIWKDLYVPCLDACLPRLLPGAIVVADNMLEPKSVRFQAERFRRHVRSIEALDSVLLTVGSGLLVCRYEGP
ncbi:MAG: methyltransferase [Proteobacteria bacterium]|nr:MAG: methyltransferase [Pseudomonadota bacterium]